ncbi:MAG: response regulator transcription factor [Deltaproteobacteria bacterium]|nr:response regulator transcription factor [Deltaproteobacteria bacterium]
MRILVVEDDLKIAQFVTDGLQQAGFVVDRAADGETGFDLASTESYDAAVIDIMLPKLDGLTLIEQLRHQNIHTPVIILSAKQSVADRVKGLQTGSDDYLTKPFAFAELLARVQALIRRGAAPVQASRLTVGDLTMDLLTREVTREGRKIDLNPREFTLLEYLMRNVGRVVSKTMILDQVWGYHFDPQTNVVDVLVCRLRNKIDKGFNDKMTHTIRGVGYVLKLSDQSIG